MLSLSVLQRQQWRASLLCCVVFFFYWYISIAAESIVHASSIAENAWATGKPSAAMIPIYNWITGQFLNTCSKKQTENSGALKRQRTLETEPFGSLDPSISRG